MINIWQWKLNSPKSITTEFAANKSYKCKHVQADAKSSDKYCEIKEEIK